MLKNILNLKGAQLLSKSNQNEINGGSAYCNPNITCPFSLPCGSGYYEWCCKCYPV